MKKLIPILLSVALCIISIHSAVFAEGRQSGLVYIGSVNGEVGETVSLPVSIKDNPGFISLVTELSYDSTALQLKSVTKNADFWSADMMPGGDLNAQPYRIIWYDGRAKSDFKENGTLASVSFEILKSGSHTVGLSVSESDTFNVSFASVPFTADSGKVETKSGTGTTAVTTAVTTAATTTATQAATATVSTAVTETTAAPDAGKAMLTLRKVTGAVGETVEVPLSIKNNPGFISLAAEISYDTAALKLKNVKRDADFWKSASMTPGGDLSAQPYRIIWYHGLAKTDFKEDGTLAVLSFEILKAGSHQITLSVPEGETFNTAFQAVSVAGDTGVIEASSGSASETTVTTTAVTTTSASKSATVTTTSATVTGVSESTVTTVTTGGTTEPQYLTGDINDDGEVSVEDAQLALLEYVNAMTGLKSSLTEKQKLAGDVNGDKEISVEDAQTILMYYVYNTLSGSQVTWDKLLGK